MSESNFDHFQKMWRETEPAVKKKWRIALLIFVLLWIAGAVVGYSQVGGVAALKEGSRMVVAIFLGPWSLLWGLVKLTGLVVETPDAPSAGWTMLILAQGGAFYLVGTYLFGEPNRLIQDQRAAKRQKEAQGQLSEAEAAAKLAIEEGVSVGIVQNKQSKPVKVGLDYKTGEGHMLIAAPTRGGKGLQLTEALLSWPGATVVVDPKAEQYKRLAGYRARHVGPVYRIPGHQMHLAGYYNFRDPDDIQELHAHLLQPDRDRERIFADKSLSLFQAVGYFARARGLNPLRVLLDAANGDIQKVLLGLETVPAATVWVRQFTNGRAPHEFATDRFATSAYGTFNTRLYGYQKHIDTICPQSRENVIPPNWVNQKATIFITYSLNDLQGAGGVVAAMLAGLMRYHKANGQRQRMLVAIDELPAVQLRNLEMYLATSGGFGITMLIYVQAIAQLERIYGTSGTEAILSNCAHQVWYPPNDMATARRVSALYGTTLKPHRSTTTSRRTLSGGTGEDKQNQTVTQVAHGESLQEVPLLSPTEVMALPKDRVIVLTERDRQYRFIGQRLNPLPNLAGLPPAPRVPLQTANERVPTVWLPQDAAPPPDQTNGINAAQRHNNGSTSDVNQNDLTDETQLSKKRPSTGWQNKIL